MDGLTVQQEEIRIIPVDMIDVSPDRLRLPRPEIVAAIAATMAEGHQGQIVPIIVAARGNRFLLGKGATRLAAARKAGLDTIKAVVRDEAFSDEELKAETITATLLKGNLSKLERAEYLTEWDRLTKELGLRQWGGDKRSKRVAEVEARENEQGIILLPCSDLEALEIDKMALSRARKVVSISAPVKLAIRGTHLEDHQGELLALAERSYEEQSEIVEMILDPECEATKVAEALTLMQGMSLPQKENTTFLRANQTVQKLKSRDFDALISANRDRVFSSLERTCRDELVEFLKAKGII